MVWYIVVGVLSGIMGAMGLGGGTLLIPMLITFFAVEQKTAQFINLVSFVFVAAVAVIQHKKNNLINFSVGTIFAIFGGLFALIVSLMCSKIKSEILSKIFGWFLLVVGIFQLFSNIKNQKEKCKKKY